VQAANKRSVFTTISLLPAFMLMCYLGLFFYFRSRGGYQPLALGRAEEGEPGF
jgi:DHA2 family metal-tetracycline-proton antiporter-like MFS transporter